MAVASTWAHECRIRSMSVIRCRSSVVFRSSAMGGLENTRGAPNIQFRVLSFEFWVLGFESVGSRFRATGAARVRLANSPRRRSRGSATLSRQTQNSKRKTQNPKLVILTKNPGTFYEQSENRGFWGERLFG